MAYTQIDLGTLRTRLAERYESVPWWDDTDADGAINEALSLYGTLTGIWTGRGDPMQLTPNGPMQALPSTLMVATRVACNGRPLAREDRLSMNQHRPTWEGETTASGGDVPTRPTIWMPNGLYSIFIWPAPAAAFSFTLVVDGRLRPPYLTRSVDYLNLPESSVGPILGCALHVLSVDQGVEIFQATLPYWKTFMQACAEQNARVKGLAAYRQAMREDLRFSRQPNVPSEAPIPDTVGGGAAGAAGTAGA